MTKGNQERNEGHGPDAGKRGGPARRRGRLRSADLLLSEPNRLITPEEFVADGQSLEAQLFNREWTQAKRAGELSVMIICGDARSVYNPRHSVAFRSISGAHVPEALFGKGNALSKEFGTKFAVVMAHHDGETVVPGEVPGGCGGRGAKGKMRGGAANGAEIEGSARFVQDRVISDDPILSTISSAISITERSGLPALAVTEDHRTGSLTVLGAVMPTANGGIEIISEIPVNEFFDQRYEAKTVYANGIPVLGRKKKIPDVFEPFLKRHELYRRDLLRQDRNFSENQRVQDPQYVLFTTVLRASRGRLPTFSGSSKNKVFAITVARNPGAKDAHDVDRDSLTDAMDELHFPISQAEASGGTSPKPFSTLYKNGILIIETRSIETSQWIALQLCQKPWFRKWAERHGDRPAIMLAETTDGIARRAEYFQVPK